jgi:hypothetical protein
MDTDKIVLILGFILAGITIWKKPIGEFMVVLALIILILTTGLFLTITKEFSAAISTQYWGLLNLIAGVLVGRITKANKGEESNKPQQKV